MYDHARKLAAEGRYIEALPILDTLLQQYPDEPQVLYAKATCLAKLGRVNEAQALCERLEREHNHARAAALKVQLTAIAPSTPQAAPAPKTTPPTGRRRTSTVMAVVGICAAVLIAGVAFLLLGGESGQAPGNAPVEPATSDAPPSDNSSETATIKVVNASPIDLWLQLTDANGKDTAGMNGPIGPNESRNVTVQKGGRGYIAMLSHNNMNNALAGAQVVQRSQVWTFRLRLEGNLAKGWDLEIADAGPAPVPTAASTSEAVPVPPPAASGAAAPADLPVTSEMPGEPAKSLTIGGKEFRIVARLCNPSLGPRVDDQIRLDSGTYTVMQTYKGSGEQGGHSRMHVQQRFFAAAFPEGGCRRLASAFTSHQGFIL